MNDNLETVREHLDTIREFLESHYCISDPPANVFQKICLSLKMAFLNNFTAIKYILLVVSRSDIGLELHHSY